MQERGLQVRADTFVTDRTFKMGVDYLSPIEEVISSGE